MLASSEQAGFRRESVGERGLNDRARQTLSNRFGVGEARNIRKARCLGALCRNDRDVDPFEQAQSCSPRLIDGLQLVGFTCWSSTSRWIDLSDRHSFAIDDQHSRLILDADQNILRHNLPPWFVQLNPASRRPSSYCRFRRASRMGTIESHLSTVKSGYMRITFRVNSRALLVSPSIAQLAAMTL